MNVKISACWLTKAAAGDEAAYQQILSSVKGNINGYDDYALEPCHCTPRCTPLTRKQTKSLWSRLQQDMRKVDAELREKRQRLSDL